MEIDRLVVGNWKMNGTFAENLSLITGIKDQLNSKIDCTIAVCPPAIYIEQVKNIIADSKIGLGAQNVCEYDNGAYTGEVSSQMLKDLDCHYCIIGHSERRAIYLENDASIAKKCKKLLEVGIIPILCVGESLAEREAGITDQIVLKQLKSVVDYVGIDKFLNIVIAYEPVWAIGTGKTATPEIAEDTHKTIRNFLHSIESEIAKKVPILYGGSVKGDNAKALFSMPNINGGLIGGASLKVKDFLSIVLA